VPWKLATGGGEIAEVVEVIDEVVEAVETALGEVSLCGCRQYGNGVWRSCGGGVGCSFATVDADDRAYRVL
jgi:hypothetical protein